MPLAGGYAIELEYRDDVLVMPYDKRVAHGGAVGVRSVF